jgi:hypothetical protein
LSYNFFWEDPFDIGQVDSYSYSQLLTVPNSNSYYRPLALIVLKALKLGGDAYPAWAYHLFVVVGHVLAGVLLYGFTLQMFRRHGLAFATGVIFLIYPLPFEATARASSFHHWLVAALVACLWLYARWREGGRALLLVPLAALLILALGLHENAVLLPGLLVVLEVWLRWQGRVARFQPAVFFFGLPAAAFVLLWLSIPKSGEAPQFGLHLRESLYLSQGISFVAAGPIAWLGGLGLLPGWQASLALLAAAGLLLAAHWRGGLPRLALALSWWLVAMSLAWLARPIEYLQVSPRVMYFPSFAAALAWAGILDLGLGWLASKNTQRAVAAVALGLVIVPAWWALQRSIGLYRQGTLLMNQIVASGVHAGAGAQLLYINVPDRFEYRQPLYPLGYWGMLVAPVSQDLSDFVWLASGVRMETRSLSDFPLLAAPVEASPYRVNTRGVDAHAGELLYDTVVWADETYWTDYASDGRLSMRPVGDIRAAGDGVRALGRFGDFVKLSEVDAAWDGRAISLTLHWLPMQKAQPTDTIFVHVVDQNGNLVAQGDGDSLGGLTPPSAWRPGHEIVDRRTLIANQPWSPGEYGIKVGIYDRATGQRHPAFTQTGEMTPDAALEIFRWIIP